MVETASTNESASGRQQRCFRSSKLVRASAERTGRDEGT